MSKTILITGAGGVLAKKLIEKFRTDNEYNVIASSRNIDEIAPKNMYLNYVNNDDLINTNVMEKVDIIINCAFPRTEDEMILQEAREFFQCLVSKAVDFNVKGFINISSQSVYGNYRKYPSSEVEQVKPEDNYANTKLLCEKLGYSLTQNSLTHYTDIRLASLIGQEYPERVINKMIKGAVKTHKISVQNDKNIMGYLDVSDATEGLYQFVKNSKPENWKTIYNFGPEYENAINLEKFALIIKSLFEYINLNIELEINRAENADKLCTMDSSWFYEAAGWEPKIPIEKSIEKIFHSMV